MDTKVRMNTRFRNFLKVSAASLGIIGFTNGLSTLSAWGVANFTGASHDPIFKTISTTVETIALSILAIEAYILRKSANELKPDKRP